MDTIADTESNAKVSESAYSKSCSNSQSRRRSHSSKSTHSESNSSGSSGYGSKPTTSCNSNNAPNQALKKYKDSKKKKQAQIEVIAAETQPEVKCRSPEPSFVIPKEVQKNVVVISAPEPTPSEKGVESMEISSPEADTPKDEEGFSCVISMHDGVVLYTTVSITATLGFPTNMWVGRSFIDFVHPNDRNTFASQITSGLAVPQIINGTLEKVISPGPHGSSMVCRIRKYSGLQRGFGVKEMTVAFMPFLLKLTFKDVNDDEGKVIYLVLQATPLYSAFKTSNERIANPLPFTMRHNANGNLEYIDPDSVPYLGYLPQDIVNKDALQLYHPEDLPYIQKVYELIVKEGGPTRTKSYRILSQNGEYVKLETEWTSFVNPCSKKLEFVIGKHYIIEGPTNPDVFHRPVFENKETLSDEQKNIATSIRENIIKIMNDALTKPAEVAKQQMSKRCHEVALFMESLMEEQPKPDEELRLDIQDPDNNNYERDSVMLGGISPHHDYNDGKSSTETMLSYTQLNYNETMQRYFDTHQPYSYEDYNTVGGENIFGLNNMQTVVSNHKPPTAENFGDSAELNVSGQSNGALLVDGNPTTGLNSDFTPPRLTETLLTKHNADMEKEFVKIYRDSRSSGKGERDKSTNKGLKKKKEHLARCNALFHNTTADVTHVEPQAYGLKRSALTIDTERNPHKYHCSSPRQLRRNQLPSNAITPSPTSLPNEVSATQWRQNPVNNMNYIVGVGIPQQMPLMSHMPSIPNMYPMYYTSTSAQQMQASPDATTTNPGCSSAQYRVPPMQCMIYGQPVYGSPYMYSPIHHQMPYQMQQTAMAHSMEYANRLNTLGLGSSNYEEACKLGLLPRPSNSSGRRQGNKCSDAQVTSSKTIQESGNSSNNTLNRSTEAVPDTSASRDAKSKTTRTSEGTVDRTDGESSYSSFYSSFFKTESGSAEDSDTKKAATLNVKNRFENYMDAVAIDANPHKTNVPLKRKMEPPWLEKVCVTSELIYKYQITTKNIDEVLKSDKQKMSTVEQSSLVNEQLGQLYLDLQLEGVAARLSLEEGITSSSSSSEDSTTNGNKNYQKERKKRQYGKLVMIYEEDAPLPSGSESEYPMPSTSGQT